MAFCEFAQDDAGVWRCVNVDPVTGRPCRASYADRPRNRHCDAVPRDDRSATRSRSAEFPCVSRGDFVGLVDCGCGNPKHVAVFVCLVEEIGHCTPSASLGGKAEWRKLRPEGVTRRPRRCSPLCDCYQPQTETVAAGAAPEVSVDKSDSTVRPETGDRL